MVDEKFKNLCNLPEATLLVNAPAMPSMQFFPSGKYTVQPPYNLVVSFWDWGWGGGTNNGQAQD